MYCAFQCHFYDCRAHLRIVAWFAPQRVQEGALELRIVSLKQFSQAFDVTGLPEMFCDHITNSAATLVIELWHLPLQESQHPTIDVFFQEIAKWKEPVDVLQFRIEFYVRP